MIEVNILLLLFLYASCNINSEMCSFFIDFFLVAGFYICWGCLVWVPSIYTSPGMYLVNHPVNLGAQVLFFFFFV